MALPFLGKANIYQPMIWPELVIRLEENHIAIHSESMLRTLGNTLWGGGAGEADRFVNMHVPTDFDSCNPEQTLKLSMERWGYSTSRTVGFMTAAWLKYASVHEETGDHYRLVVCTTAGIGNAARAGVVRPVFSSYRTGTINILIFIQGIMTMPAMLEGIIAATEAKAAAMQDMSVVDRKTSLIATGTTSDAIVLAYSPVHFKGVVHQHAGTATTIGNAIGRLVYNSICESVQA